MRTHHLLGALALGVTLMSGCNSEECPNGLIAENDPNCGCDAFPDNPLCGEECPDGFVGVDDPVCNCDEFPDDAACRVDTPGTIDGSRELSPSIEEAATWEENIYEGGDRDMFAVTQQTGQWYFAWANRPGTEADGSASGGTPDTVLRMYTGDGTEIAVNDDMPYRYENTDAGMWWQAVSDDPVYVEVLEWADWRADEGDNENPTGGDQYAYQLVVLQTDSEERVGENDTIEECFAGTEASFAATRLSTQTAMVFGNGEIETAGDVDFFELGFEGFTSLPEDSELMCQFGFWPDQPSALSPRLRVYWEDCSPIDDMDAGDCDGTGDDIYLLGETTTPDLTPTGRFLGEDAGVLGVIPDGRYYAEVSSTDDGFGVDHYYTLMYGCFNTSNFLKETEVGSTDPTEATIAPLNNPNSPDTYFGRFYGNFRPTGEFQDDFDAWALVDGLGNGRFLDVEIESELVGSTTGDITLTLWRNNGGGDFTELESVTGPDPEILDYELTAADVALVVTLQTDGSVQDYSTGYYGLALVTPDAG